MRGSHVRTRREIDVYVDHIRNTGVLCDNDPLPVDEVYGPLAQVLALT